MDKGAALEPFGLGSGRQRPGQHLPTHYTCLRSAIGVLKCQ
jgi:hypothetical protein